MLTAHLLHARPELLTSSTWLINCVSSAVPLPHRVIKGWLPGQDSNLDKRIQSPWCYHYTTRHLAVYYTISVRVCCQRSGSEHTHRTGYLLRLPIVTLFQRDASAAQLARRPRSDHSPSRRLLERPDCQLDAVEPCLTQLTVWAKPEQSPTAFCNHFSSNRRRRSTDHIAAYATLGSSVA